MSERTPDDLSRELAREQGRLSMLDGERAHAREDCGSACGTGGQEPGARGDTDRSAAQSRRQGRIVPLSFPRPNDKRLRGYQAMGYRRESRTVSEPSAD